MTAISLCALLLVHAQLPSLTTVDAPRTRGEWCGAKAVHIVAESFGHTSTFDEVKTLCDPNGESRGSNNLKAMTVAFREMGFAARAVRCLPNALARLPGPAITRHEWSVLEDDGTVKRVAHFMVFLKTEGDAVHFVDPSLFDAVQVVPLERYAASFTGDALLVARSNGDLPIDYHGWLTMLCYVACGAVLILFGEIGVRILAFRPFAVG